MTTEAKTVTVPENGETVFIPLNKLKKHPKNARKTPHSEASIAAKAASIAAKGMLQNLVVGPELDTEGQPTGCYLVSVGEGRRLAQLLRVKRKEIKKTEPIRCVIDTANDPAEISLDENVTREDLHPADQFERFRELAEHRGWGAEEIAARFGVTAHVVKQRLRLGAVSPKLMQVYRDSDLTLDQLMAFALTEDHARQEQVYANLSYNRDPSFIRRELTKANVAATDRRAVFVGAEAYTEAGGNIIRDLFTEDRGGFFEDARFWTGLSSRSWNGSLPRFRRRKAGNGFRSISTIPMPMACAAPIRSRWCFPRKMNAPTRPYAANTTGSKRNGAQPTSFRPKPQNALNRLKPRSSASTPSAMPTILTSSREAACSWS